MFALMHKCYSTIYSFWLLVPSGNVAQEDGYGRRVSTSSYPHTPSLFIQSLLYKYLFHVCTPSPYPSIFSILQLSFLSFWDPQLCSYTLFSQTLRSSFSQDDQTISKYFFSLIPYHYASLPLHKVSCHTFHTHFHCSHLLISSRHMLLSDDSFPHHTLLTAVPYSMSKSLIHTSMLIEECCSLKLFLPPWIHSLYEPKTTDLTLDCNVLLFISGIDWPCSW